MGTVIRGGIELLEPDARLQVTHNAFIESWLLGNGYSGTNTNNQIINRALHGLFAELNEAFSTYMQKLSSRNLSDYFLFQYEQLSKVIKQHLSGKLNAADDLWCQKNAPSIQIALRFIVERIVLLGEQDDSSIKQSDKNVQAHYMYLCAKSLVDLSVLSDQTFRAYPEHTRMTVTPGGTPFWELKLDALDPSFSRRLTDAQLNNSDKQRMKELLNNIDIAGDSELRRKHLDSPLTDLIGADLRTVHNVLSFFAQPFRAPDGRFPIPFRKEEMLFEHLSQRFSLDREIIKNIVKAFLLTRENMSTETHELYISDNDYRSFIRPLFRLPHADGWHITYSPEMVRESIDHFHTMLAFQKGPAEWMPALSASLSRLTNEITKKFENRFAELMTERGFEGRRFKDSVGTQLDELAIPKDVGELDYLGYSAKHNLILVAECKLCRWGSTPKDYFNDRREFIDNVDSHLSQVTRKANWVKKELPKILKGMKSVHAIPKNVSTPLRVAHCIVTYYPTPVSLFVRTCPCISFSRLMDAIDQSGDWPFANGVETIN